MPSLSFLPSKPNAWGRLQGPRKQVLHTPAPSHLPPGLTQSCDASGCSPPAACRLFSAPLISLLVILRRLLLPKVFPTPSEDS